MKTASEYVNKIKRFLKRRDGGTVKAPFQHSQTPERYNLLFFLILFICVAAQFSFLHVLKLYLVKPLYQKILLLL